MFKQPLPRAHRPLIAHTQTIVGTFKIALELFCVHVDILPSIFMQLFNGTTVFYRLNFYSIVKHLVTFNEHFFLIQE